MFETSIAIEPGKDLTVAEKRKLLELAYASHPSAAMRGRLAALYLQEDAFDAVIDLFDGVDDFDYGGAMLLVQALLARETAADNLRARDVADRAVELAGEPWDRAAALADRAKAQVRLGQRDGARATLAEALALDAGNKNACKRLAALDLADGDHAAVLAMADDLTARGAAHARLFAARALALAGSGAVDAARAANGFDLLSTAVQLSPPPGWADIDAFNAALAAELLAHPGLRYERYGTASELTWRVDAPATRDAPLVKALMAQIQAALGAHIARIAGADHPWARARPQTAVLHGWCVITDGDGFETWHVHQFGWLSGVYYVQVPDAIASGNSDGGCIAFGLPEDMVGDDAAAAYGSRVIRPRGGMMLAFPSHSYHRTFPHLSGGRRIAFAFDLWPV